MVDKLIRKKIAGVGITYDDVLLLPDYSDFSRGEIEIRTKLTKKIALDIPFVSAPMDTVTESKLAIALAELGGIGIIHRNLTVSNQVAEVTRVKAKKLKVGAAIGTSSGYEDRVKGLVKEAVDVIVVDSAHGLARPVVETVKYIKKHFPKIQVIAGNVATARGAEMLIKAGADGLRVGMGPGAICTTRIVSGMGVPQITALFETVSIAKKYGIPVIADGGIRYSGDMVKAFVAGAATVMMGGMFAACLEAPGKTVKIKKNGKTELFKEYRGMGSLAAMKKGAKIKSEDEFHGKAYKDRILVAEGVEGLVKVKGTVKELIDQAIGGIKSGMYYVGAKNIKYLQEKTKFVQITQASLTESHPHDLLITNPGKNY